MIADSLTELGAGRSILVDAGDTIIAGNGVYEQAKKLGIKVKVIESDGKTLYAIKRKDLKGARARRMALLDNRSTETSEWDSDVLAQIAESEREMLDSLFMDNELALILARGTDRIIEDPTAEWQGMPEFKQEHKLGIKVIFVHFDSQEAVDNFSQLVGQPITPQTKYIWFPKREEAIRPIELTYSDEPEMSGLHHIKRQMEKPIDKQGARKNGSALSNRHRAARI